MTVALAATLSAPGQNDVADVPSQERQAGSARKTYLLIGHAEGAKEPAGGYKLVVVLPGGDGSAAFHPFVKRMYKHGVPDGYLVAQLVAVKWSPDQQIVWPHKKNPVPKMEFGTEAFIEDVIADVGKRHAINAKHVFTLSWSSSGPAAYAASLQRKTSVTGSYVAMSVYNQQYLPPLPPAKGRAYYIEHSPEDKVCPFWMAKRAREDLVAAEANVQFSEYGGGHGWRGNVYGRIRKAIGWLEENTK